MKLLKFVMYLFYNYYKKGGTFRIPYVSALCATVFLIYIHLFQLLIIFNAVDLLPVNTSESRIIRYLKFAVFLLPFFLIVALLVKEKDLKAASYGIDRIRKGNIFLIIYVILSVILLFVLMFLFA